MRRLTPASVRSVNSIATLPIATSYARVVVCWLPTWNDRPYGSSPSSPARSISASAFSTVVPNLRDSGQSAPSFSTRMRQ